jgi:hypothetical protein
MMLLLLVPPLLLPPPLLLLLLQCGKGTTGTTAPVDASAAASAGALACW